MTKIDLNVKLKKLSGEDIKNQDQKLTILGDVCINALLLNFDTEKIDGKEKVRRFKLAQRLYGVKEPISFEAEDIVLMKELIARAYPPLIVGQAWELLDSTDEKTE